MPSPSELWVPPSNALEFLNGVWCSKNRSMVSYPDDGNDGCFQVEDGSYWFAHRNQCIIEAVHQFPPTGTIYDIGGGNGFVAKGLLQAGWDTAVVEPGHGAFNAARRGLKKVICAALEDTGLKQKSLPAAGAFDVIEHIEKDVEFIESIKNLLEPGGRFYCTVPAANALWSDEDIHAGHFRRHSPASLAAALGNAGLEVEFVTGFFAWLTLPIFFLRALPFRWSGGLPARRGSIAKVDADHRLPKVLSRPVKYMQDWELRRFRQKKAIPFGASLLGVAHAPRR
jgi:SAM-dependent methyltransferase